MMRHALCWFIHLVAAFALVLGLVCLIAWPVSYYRVIGLSYDEIVQYRNFFSASSSRQTKEIRFSLVSFIVHDSRIVCSVSESLWVDRDQARSVAVQAAKKNRDINVLPNTFHAIEVQWRQNPGPSQPGPWIAIDSTRQAASHGFMSKIGGQLFFYPVDRRILSNGVTGVWGGAA